MYFTFHGRAEVEEELGTVESAVVEGDMQQGGFHLLFNPFTALCAVQNYVVNLPDLDVPGYARDDLRM